MCMVWCNHDMQLVEFYGLNFVFFHLTHACTTLFLPDPLLLRTEVHLAKDLRAMIQVSAVSYNEL